MKSYENNTFLGLRPRDFALPESLSKDIEIIDRSLGTALIDAGEENIIRLARALFADSEDEKCVGDCDISGADEPRPPEDLFARFPELNDPVTMSRVLRAFTILFQLVNIAEQKEIVRANRKRQAAQNVTSDATAPVWRPESIGEAIRRLAESGVTAEQIQVLLDRMEIIPTITAHPTEARRRAVMDKLLAFGDALTDRNIPPDATQLESPLDLPRERADAEMRRQVVALWNTDELRSTKVSVIDEVNNSVYFFQRTILEVVSWLHQDLQQALRRLYPGHEFHWRPFIQYRSWVGGDRDGNPNVTPKITRSTVLYHKQVILGHYLVAVESVMRELSLSSRILAPSKKLLDSLEKDAQLVNLDETEIDRFNTQPYAMKLDFMKHRLKDSLTHVGHLANIQDMAPSEMYEDCPAAYMSAVEFVEDLNILCEALEHGPTRALVEGGPLFNLRVQAQTFGFHLASLDIRQHSQEHAEVLDELFEVAGVTGSGVRYSEMSEEQKLELLEKELKSPRPLLPRNWVGSEKATKTLRVFEVIRFARRHVGTESINAYVISMTHQVSDMLEVLVLAREAGLVRWVRNDATGGDKGMRLESELDIVPLFETIEDLQHCDALMDRLFGNETFRLHLAARGNFQELMLGYSDSSKDGGYLAANWNLQDTQDRLAASCHRAGVDFRFFHGRGGTVGRGGGRASRAILSQPRGSFTGRIRFTEQGEVVSFRYALRPMAHRHLEQIVNSVLLALSQEPTIWHGKKPPELKQGIEIEPKRNHEQFGPVMEQMAAHSRKVYRALVYEDPQFWDFYTQATPIAHISQLPITSRPAMRGGGKLAGLDELRAIPWVFAWVQSRYVVPGWYGLGTALEEFASRDEPSLEIVRNMYENWPFFRTVIDNAQLELVRTHLPTAAFYAGRVQPESLARHFHEMLAQEYARSCKWVLSVTRQAHMLDSSPVVQATVRMRNPVVLPLNKLQVQLMKIWDQLPESERDASGPWREPLLLSITSIAAGMQSTG